MAGLWEAQAGDEVQGGFSDFASAQRWLVGKMEAEAAEAMKAGHDQYLRLAAAMVRGYREHPFEHRAENRKAYSVRVQK